MSYHNRYEAERTLESFRRGEISEWEARDRLERDYSCSCERRAVDDIVRDVSSGWRDERDGADELERESRRCEQREEEAREEREREAAEERRRYEASLESYSEDNMSEE